MNETLYHHSHQLFYRTPFGAVEVGTQVTLRLGGSFMQEADRAEVRLWREGKGEEIIPMHPMKTPGSAVPGESFWETVFQVAESPGLVWYYFIVHGGGAVRYYGNNHRRKGGLGQEKASPPPSFQLTVYQPGIHVPGWFREGIIYQIFPDRFRREPPNSFPGIGRRNCFYASHWEDDPVYVKDPDTGTILRWDFHGGNLAGVIEKLSYLKELGVSILYLNPIFEAVSNHRYDTGDYHQIDSLLGTGETFSILCSEARQKGMRVILDGVFSHTGSDSRYFNREGTYDTLGAYQSKASPYFPWYRFRNHPEDYESWWGIDTMPNTNELENSFRQFVLEDPDSVVRKWIREGASGWRLDVADELPTSFIRLLRKVVKETDPQSVVIGEVWEDASHKVSHGQRRSYLLGEELDSVMNYPFRDTVIRLMLGWMSGEEACEEFMSLYENYPEIYFHSCMNLVGSHDRARILTILGEAPDESTLTEKEKMKYRLPEKQRSMAIKRLKALMAFQMTYPGVPSIYYGDEAGLEGYTDPLNRRPFPWGREDQDILEWTRKMTALRNRYPVFQKGQWSPLCSGAHHLGFVRLIPDEACAITILNCHVDSPLSLHQKCDKIFDGSYIDAMTNQTMTIQGRRLQLEVPPLTSRILVWQPASSGSKNSASNDHSENKVSVSDSEDPAPETG